MLGHISAIVGAAILLVIVSIAAGIALAMLRDIWRNWW